MRVQHIFQIYCHCISLPGKNLEFFFHRHKQKRHFKMPASCGPCPCYTTPVASFPVIVPWQNGKCETNITIPFVDGPFWALWTALWSLPVAQPHPDRTFLEAMASEYQNTMKSMRSPVHNATKTAISSVYFSVLLVWVQTESMVFLNDAKVYAEQVICWIQTQRAYDGPCAVTVMSVAQLLGVQCPCTLSNMVSGPEQQTLDAIQAFNRAAANVINNHSCCDVGPMVLGYKVLHQ